MRKVTKLSVFAAFSASYVGGLKNAPFSRNPILPAKFDFKTPEGLPVYRKKQRNRIGSRGAPHSNNIELSKNFTKNSLRPLRLLRVLSAVKFTDITF